jgi:hypothetical protein
MPWNNECVLPLDEVFVNLVLQDMKYAIYHQHNAIQYLHDLLFIGNQMNLQWGEDLKPQLSPHGMKVRG